jgi:alpha-ketoglutarate-dependent taurine dioxygenase
VYRHKVHNGDLPMWDNGCTMHRRDEMRLDQPRLMKRTTFRLPARSGSPSGASDA